MNTRKFLILTVLMILALVLVACAGQGETVGTIPTNPAETGQTTTPTAVPPTVMPTATPDVQATHMAAQATLIAAQATTIANLQAAAAAPTQTPAPTATPIDADVFLTDNCSILGGDPPDGTVCFPRDPKTPDYTLPIPEGGYTLVAFGSGRINNMAVSPVDATTGHIVLIPGSKPDGKTPEDLNLGLILSDYISGSVAVTHVTRLTTYEAAVEEAKVHAIGMVENPPNCGDAGCVRTYMWVWDWEEETLVLAGLFTADDK